MSTTTTFTTPFSWKSTSRTTTSPRPQPILAIATWPPPQKQPQITHSMPREKVQVFKSLEPWVSKHILPLLKPVEKCWQPTQFLPDPTKPKTDFMDEVVALQNHANRLPDEYFVVLVGNMIIEDAIPTYQTVVNAWDGIGDETGASPTPWATWIRGWTAEENRHGDLLRTYLYLSGRVDMVMIERTVQYLIGAGMDGGFENNPYLGIVYTSFQERATFVNHGNVARLAKESGDPLLATICGTIAADEKRHENAYVNMIEKLLEVDPNETMVAIGKMMRNKLSMPGQLMYDGQDTNLFEHMSLVNQKLGVFNVDDYVKIVKFLIERWNLEKVEGGLKGDGRREQEFVCGLPNRIANLQEIEEKRGGKRRNRKPRKVRFSWIFNKEITV